MTDYQCLCGRIRIEARPPARRAGHCHCDNCRRANGAAFWTWVTYPRDQVRFVAGEGDLQRYRHPGPGSVRGFCRHCGTTLTWEAREPDGDIDLGMANALDDVGMAPQRHVFADRAVPWVETEDGLPRFGGPDGMQPL